MTSSPTFRPAYLDERARAASLCPPGPALPGEGPVECYVAVKDSPVERLVGAAFWREVPGDTSGASVVEFEWSMIAALGGTADEQAFLEALRHEVARAVPGAGWLQASPWLPDQSAPAAILGEAGFHPHERRTMYTGEIAEWSRQLDSGAPEPDCRNIVAPAQEHFDVLKGLLCGRNSGLRPSELAQGFHTMGSQSPSLFDPRCSAVLLAGETPVGACLANVDASHSHLILAALEVVGDYDDRVINSLLRHVLKSTAVWTDPPAGLGFQEIERLPTSDNPGPESETTSTMFRAATEYPVTPVATTYRYRANPKTR